MDEPERNLPHSRLNVARPKALWALEPRVEDARGRPHKVAGELVPVHRDRTAALDVLLQLITLEVVPKNLDFHARLFDEEVRLRRRVLFEALVVGRDELDRERLIAGVVRDAVRLDAEEEWRPAEL